MKGKLEFADCYRDKDVLAKEALLEFKRYVQPRVYVTPEELKQIVSDWIDLNLTNCIA